MRERERDFGKEDIVNGDRVVVLNSILVGRVEYRYSFLKSCMRDCARSLK